MEVLQAAVVLHARDLAVVDAGMDAIIHVEVLAVVSAKDLVKP